MNQSPGQSNVPAPVTGTGDGTIQPAGKRALRRPSSWGFIITGLGLLPALVSQITPLVPKEWEPKLLIAVAVAAFISTILKTQETEQGVYANEAKIAVVATTAADHLDPNTPTKNSETVSVLRAVADASPGTGSGVTPSATP